MEGNKLARAALETARRMQRETGPVHQPLPQDVTPPADQPILPHSLFYGTRGYIEKVVFQINRCYTGTCYDACAVMMRRLVEMLIIEAFEHRTIATKIQESGGDYMRLENLVKAVLSEKTWTLGRTTKAGLSKPKQVGDLSAHSRRYNARKEYIDDLIISLRSAAEELLYIAGLKG